MHPQQIAGHRSRRHCRRTRPWLQCVGLIRGRTCGCTPRGLLQGLGNLACHIPGPFIEQGVVLHYQEGVVVLIQDGSELDGGEGPPYYQVHELRSSQLRTPERMPVTKRILNRCRWVVAFRARPTFPRCDEGSRETAGRIWISII